MDRCTTAVQTLPAAVLQRVLRKGSMRMVKYLLFSHPQVFGARMLDSLSSVVSPATFRFIVQEISRKQVLSPAQVQDAEREFLKLVDEETAAAAEA